MVSFSPLITRSRLKRGLKAVELESLFDGTICTSTISPSVGHVISGIKDDSHQYPAVKGVSEIICQFPPVGFSISIVDSVPAPPLSISSPDGPCI